MDQRMRAEAAESALAELRARITALHDHWPLREIAALLDPPVRKGP
jgi:hypothetical protein